jgi:steroid delta-isomerase-like uncharacterized protein
MSIEENKTLLRQFIEEVFHKRNLEMVERFMAVNIIDHDPLPVEATGSEGQKQFFALFLHAFPDFHVTVNDLIAEGDKVVAHQTFQGTHQGDFLGLAPTGKQFSITGIDIIRVDEGKIVEHWSMVDNLGMMQQLGAIPTRGQATREAGA